LFYVVIGTVKVRYYSGHYGHKFDVAHTVFRKDQRQHIAGMLAAGIPFDEVLVKVRQGGDDSTVSRQNFATKRDLNNIVRDFNLSRGVTRCSYDANSVAKSTDQNHFDGEKNSHRTVDDYIAKAEQHWSVIRSAMSDDPEIAAAVNEELWRVRAMLPALNSRPHFGEVLQPHVPVNKKVSPQSCFQSTRRKSRKRKAEYVTQPNDNTIFLLDSLCNEVEVVTSTAVGTDHSYNALPDDIVVCEYNH